MRNAGCEEVVSDIGSGLNGKKPGLRSLLTKLLFGKIARLVVTHEDRLLRFGVDFIRHLCQFVKTELKVLMLPPEKTFEEELAKDVITLMTVFCARLYGRRSRKAKSRTASEEKLGNSDENKLEFNTVSNCFCGTVRR